MKDHKPKHNDYKKPLGISIALHAVLAAALLWGTDFTMSKPEPLGQMVQAVVIDPQLVQQQAQKIRSQREAASKQEQERLDKLRRESEQLEKNRKAEEERIRKLKQQQAKEAKAAREAEKRRQQKEQEQKAATEKARIANEQAAKAESERKAKEVAAKKAEAERIAKEAAAEKAEQERVAAREKAAKEAQEKARIQQEAAKKAEQERIAQEKAAKEAAEKARQEKARLEQLERERKEQEKALNSIFSGLESEAEQNTSARSKYVSSESQRWGAIYTQLIQQNLLLEDNFKGKQCKVNLRLIPTGAGAIVGDLSILGGDSRLCAATKRAVAQVGTFPLPKDEPDVTEKLKNINLTVVPE